MSTFITVDELISDPEPLDIPTKVRDKQTGDVVEKTLRFYPKRPTDVEKEMAMGAANGARRALRALLKDENSAEHRLLLRAPLEEANEDQLRTIWINGRLMERAAEIQVNSLEEREYVPEPEGEIVLPEERDQYADAVEGAENDRLTNLVKAIEAVKVELEAEAALLPKSSLIEAAMPAHIETVVAKAWHQTYTSHLMTRCFFTDAKLRKPAFKTIEAVEKLQSQRPHVYMQLSDTLRGILLDLEPGLGF